jgi:hypothetical protein
MYLFDLFAMHPYLSVLQTGFMVWMLIDAYRRPAEPFWYYVIFFVPVIGAWAYFFVVKGPDFKRFDTGNLFKRRVSLEELRYHAEHTPTLANHVALAQQLMKGHEYQEAAGYLEGALKREPDHATALHSLAVCHIEEGRYDQAVPLLERILVIDAHWSHYAAWHQLIEVKAAAGDLEGALTTARDLVKRAPSLQHHCLLAERLLDAGETEEAAQLLEQSLQDYAYAPPGVRRINRRWASQASRLQKQLSAK